ncbi:unnamed protein product [Rhizophagus irregularis]|nr:unnamed protein product [Rhizophagus irregularis]
MSYICDVRGPVRLFTVSASPFTYRQDPSWYRYRETLSLFLKRTCDTLSNLGSVAESKARYPVNPQLWVDEL